MKIFIQIASYRDPELEKTIKSAIENAKRPKNLVFGIARQYHPDVNPGNEVARDKFMAITEAYKFLLTIAKSEAELAPVTASKKTVTSGSKVPQYQPTKVKITPKSPPIEFNPELTKEEQEG